MARKLWHMPVWHNRVDCCIDSEPQEDDDSQLVVMRKLTKEGKLDNFWRGAERYWDFIDGVLPRLQIEDWRKVKIFSDSMFGTEEWEEIVLQMAKEGSRHGRVMARFLDAGATLAKTEDESSFVDEKGNRRKISTEERDKTIAQNINRELKDGETGILLLGASHNSWQQHLESDIEICHLLTKEEWDRFGLC